MSWTVGADSPHVLIRWGATSLTTSWGAYSIWRRSSSAKAKEWRRIGRITTTASAGSITATNAEAYRTFFRDYEVATSPIKYDYRVTVETSGGVSSAVKDVDFGVQTTQSDHWYLVNNLYPELNCAFHIVDDIGTSFSNVVDVIEPGGRDFSITSVKSRKPGQTKQLSIRAYDSNLSRELMPSFEGLFNHIYDAIYHPTKRPPMWALVSNYGMVWYGTPYLTSIASSASVGQTGLTDLGLTFVETSNVGNVDCNFQTAHLVMLTNADKLTLPKSEALQVRLGEAISVYGLVSVNPTSTESDPRLYEFRGNTPATTSAGHLIFSDNDQTPKRVRTTLKNSAGATTTLDVNYSGVVSDVDKTVFLGFTHDTVGGTAVCTLENTEVSSNSSALAEDFSHDATANVTAFRGEALGTRATALVVYKRAFGADERLQIQNALRGYPGWRLPHHPELYYDFRDPDCFAGLGTTVYDLSGNRLDGTTVSSPIYIPAGN